MKGVNRDTPWIPEGAISLTTVTERNEDPCWPLPQAINNGGYLSSCVQLIYHKVAWEATDPSL